LHLIRKKRNQVFHRDKQAKKRTVTEEEARKAAFTALVLFYKMINLDPEKGVFAYLDLRKEIWNTISR